MRVPFPRRAASLALAILLTLSTVAAAGFASIPAASAAETDVNDFAPAGTTLVSKDAKVQIFSAIRIILCKTLQIIFWDLSDITFVTSFSDFSVAES